MKAIHLFAMVLAILALFSGCMRPETQAMNPVDASPDWIEPEEISPGDPDSGILIFFDNTQSMFGFSGVTDSPISNVAVALTNLARFDEQVGTYRLTSNEAQSLIWEEADPLVIASSVMVSDKSSYTYTGEFHNGGPLTAAFQAEPDPGQVRILVTDLLEQESELDSLTSYVEKQFRSDSRQQLRIYVANTDYDGFVSYPVVKEDTLQIETTYYAGQRPFVVIVTGHAAGVEKIHQVLTGTGISFAQFMVENHRSEPEKIHFQPGQFLAGSILLEDPASIHCTANLEEHPLLKDCFAYSYRKVSANKAPFSRLSLMAQTNLPVELSVGRVNWFQWAAQEAEEEMVAYTWECCDPPEDVQLFFSPVESGAVIPGRDASETGLEDLVVPSNHRLWELSLLMNEASAGEAYAVQVELTVPVEDNPLASTTAFDVYDIPFAAYGNAKEDPSIMTRIPDLKLMLSALAKMDDATVEATVADVRIVIQNFEAHYNNEEEKT